MDIVTGHWTREEEEEDGAPLYYINKVDSRQAPIRKLGRELGKR